MIRFPSRLQTSFLGLFVSVIVINTTYSHLLFSDLVIARFTAIVMLVFVSMWLLFGSVWVNGHKAYDHMEDLYVQTEGERILILSRDGQG